jgi:hypothetical protein
MVSKIAPNQESNALAYYAIVIERLKNLELFSSFNYALVSKVTPKQESNALAYYAIVLMTPKKFYRTGLSVLICLCL